MAATVTGSKTVNNAVAPHLPAAALTALLATPVENLTIAQFKQLQDAFKRMSGGSDPNRTIGSLLI
jgi:hypothetical protein